MNPTKTSTLGGLPPRKRSDTPFQDSAEAWFWTVSALRSRRDGQRANAYGAKVSRPCEPDDVVRCVQKLLGDQMLGLDHARVLEDVGAAQFAPDPARGQGAKLRLWREALDKLDAPLRRKGIVL